MLDLSPPFWSIPISGGEHPELVAVFRDHERRGRFYVLPPTPRLAEVDGQPAFLVRAWRPDLNLDPDARGGGLVGFEVEAGLSDAVRGTVAGEIARLTGIEAPELLPVVFRRGTVRLVLGQTVEGKVREDVSSAVPCAVVAPHHAAFLLPLDPPGAALAVALAEGGDIAAGVVYELVFEGLLPALEARVEMDYDKVWRHLSTALSGQYQCVRAELGAELQKLVEAEAIRITIANFQSEDDRADREARVMQVVQARIEADFFHSALPLEGAPPPNPLTQLLGGALGGASSSSALFVLKAHLALTTELRTFVLDLDQRAAVAVTHVSTGLLRRMIPAGEADVALLDLADAAAQPLEVRVLAPADFASTPGLTAVTVNLRRGDVATTFLFTPAGPASARFVVPRRPGDRDDTYTWSASVDFDASRGVGPVRFASPEVASTSRVLVPAVRELVAYRPVRLVRVGDTSRVAAFRVRVRAVRGDTEIATQVAVLDREGAEADLVFRDGLPEFDLYAACETVTTDGRVIASPEVLVEGGFFLVRAPVREVLRYRVVPAADWTVLRQVVVDLEHGEGEGLRRHVYTFDATQIEAPMLELAIWDDADRAVRWKQTLLYVDGRVDEGGWQVPEGSVIAVGAVPRDHKKVDVVVLNVGADALGVRVDLTPTAPGAEPVSLFFGPPFTPTPQPAQVPLVGGALAYRFTVWRYTAAGEERVAEGEGARAVLVLPLP
ncbi:MAG: hypothetical protein Q8P41_22610 [Pseudomonadota bacterium]|nr:hypothetical protein [Pseudomonadota bacterium]